MNYIKQKILLALGFSFLLIAILGIFLPLLPTTPFLLLSAICFSKSSKKAHHWLLTNRWFGEYIRNYREKRGISLRHKIVSISFLWLTIAYAVFFVIDKLWLQLLLFVIASGVTVHILSMVTYSNKKFKLFHEAINRHK